MKYLVMENHESHSIVMDQAGSFHRVAKLGYEVGDIVTDPIFMKTPETGKKNIQWKKISVIAAIFVCFILAGIPFINDYSQSDVMVYMSINPEVHLELNKDGEVRKLKADNDDGTVLLKGYEYRGKSVSSVLMELIDRAERLEFLDEGGDVQITVKSDDDAKAKVLSTDISEFLAKDELNKFMIRISVNQEDFSEIIYAAESETDETVSEATAAEATTIYYSREKTTSEKMKTSSKKKNDDKKEDATKPTPDDPGELDQAETEESIAGTETTETTGQTDVTTSPTLPTDSSSEEESSEDQDGDYDDDGEDYWPWWPWFESIIKSE